MSLYQIFHMINSKINELENEAKKETNVEKLNRLFEYISFLKIISHHINSQSFDSATINGRRVASINANDQREALAALDILKTKISGELYQFGKCVEESVYVTNEGVCWGG